MGLARGAESLAYPRPVSVGFARKQGWLDERQFTSPGNRNVIGVCQFQYGEGVCRRLCQGTISMHNAQAFHRYFRGSDGKQDGAGIVDAGVGVEEYSFWHVIPDVSL